MTTATRDGYPHGCVIDLHTSFEEGVLSLDDYLLKSSEMLGAITDLVNRGEKVDRESHDWMLTQVDFLVETIGNESLDLSDESRSNLLQFLLEIANLNENIRRQASLSF